jgi:hypothetical protein
VPEPGKAVEPFSANRRSRQPTAQRSKHIAAAVLATDRAADAACAFTNRPAPAAAFATNRPALAAAAPAAFSTLPAVLSADTALFTIGIAFTALTTALAATTGWVTPYAVASATVFAPSATRVATFRAARTAAPPRPALCPTVAVGVERHRDTARKARLELVTLKLQRFLNYLVQLT